MDPTPFLTALRADPADWRATLAVFADALEEAGDGRAERVRAMAALPRTRDEVLAARENAVAGGCCDRFADNMGCDCLTEAADLGGVWQMFYRECGICGGEGRHRYPPGGRAHVTRVDRVTLAYGYLTDPCGTCHGTGTLPAPPPTWVRCPTCDGKGELIGDPECGYCEGNGRVYDPDGRYVDSTMDCPRCDTMACPACNGRGGKWEG